MAILKGGHFHGKVGDLVYYTCNGKPCVRAVPKPTTKPPTVAQLAQRLRMKLVTQFLAPLNPMLEDTFRPHDRKRMTGLNHATRHTLAEAVIGEYPDIHIQPARVLVSCGALPKMRNPLLVFSGERQLTLTWAAANLAFVDNDDIAFLLIYNQVNGRVVVSSGEVSRGDGQLAMTVNQEVLSGMAYCYGFMTDRLRRKVSDSVFLGTIRDGVVVGDGWSVMGGR